MTYIWFNLLMLTKLKVKEAKHNWCLWSVSIRRPTDKLNYDMTSYLPTNFPQSNWAVPTQVTHTPAGLWGNQRTFLLGWTKRTGSAAGWGGVHPAQRQVGTQQETKWFFKMFILTILQCFRRLFMFDIQGICFDLFYSMPTLNPFLHNFYHLWYAKRTCKSQWAHLQFGCLCCLHRSSGQNQWRGRRLQVFALCLLWKKKQ